MAVGLPTKPTAIVDSFSANGDGIARICWLSACLREECGKDFSARISAAFLTEKQA